MKGPVEVLDLTGVPCPANSARILLKLAQRAGDTLLDIILDDGEPMENVPASLEDEGHKIVARERKGKQWKLRIQKSL